MNKVEQGKEKAPNHEARGLIVLAGGMVKRLACRRLPCAFAGL